jgi:hypothetical protein
MDYRVDEKGKVFTTKVTKQGVAVTVHIRDSIIQGMVYVSPDNRLKDELNHGETFIAITDAQVWTLNDTNPIYSTGILIINKSQIDWIFPREEHAPENQPSL